MHTYAFLLGRKPLLSIAELTQVLGEKAKIFEITSDTLLAGLETKLENPQLAIDRLGGTVKIIEIFEETSTKEELAPKIANYLVEKFQHHNKKIKYGVSTYSFTQKREIILRKTLNYLKKELTQAGLKSRFINHNFKNLENAAIKGEKLLQEGAEIVIIQGRHKIFIGETKALQDFENYSKRDYERPARDPRLGMLPPKLAQIMINLAGHTPLLGEINPKLTIYDPFVGMGTILSEGLLLGYSGLGSDIDAEVIKKCRQNLDWIRQENFNPAQSIHLFVKDATTLIQKDFTNSQEKELNLIITESYLGPPVSRIPYPDQIHKTFSNIQFLIIGFLKAIHPLIKSETPIVISMPVYKQGQRFTFIENINEKITKLGFTVEPLVPESLAARFGIKMTARKTLIYERPDQIVAREIWKLIKKQNTPPHNALKS